MAENASSFTIVPGSSGSYRGDEIEDGWDIAHSRNPVGQSHFRPAALFQSRDVGNEDAAKAAFANATGECFDAKGPPQVANSLPSWKPRLCVFGEVASQRLRARTAGIASAMSVIFGLIFNTSLPIILDVDGVDWGYKTAWLFFGTGVVVCILLYFFLPECSRRNAAEVDEMYLKGVPAWKMHKFVTEVQTMHQIRT
ncbi:hypothetical protein FDECE_13206 [Fusarium decemcellulare]|nr:hypothetical protein FDECE_13206 [Fusarium decemcellulare]